MFKRSPLPLLISLMALASYAAPAPIPLDAEMQKAVDEYNQGHVSKAVSLLMKEIKEKPDNAAAHYYLGVALKKGGADATAIAELETTIRLCPPGVLQSLAMEACRDKFKDEPAKPVEKPNWWSGLTNGIVSLVNPTKAVKQSVDRTVLDDYEDKALLAAMVGAPKPDRTAAPRMITVALGSNEGPIIHMAEMQRLVKESQKLDPSLQSHRSRVISFPQAPEMGEDWKWWIKRFCRTFDSMVFRHIAKAAKDEKSGTASIIFSLDKFGHLRGCVYNATASDTLINCLLDSIRELDRSYILAFPVDTRISGWNFRMRWNFGPALAYVQSVRQMKVDAVTRARKLYQEKLNAQLLAKKKEAELKAKAGKLARQEKLAKEKNAAKMAASQVVIKTGVAGVMLPKPKPVELKAQQLKLSDMPPIDSNLSDQEIDDLSIQAGDVSKLFR